MGHQVERAHRLMKRLDRLRVFEDSGTLRDGMMCRLAALVVVGVLACGPLVAYADPPDPTWIPGLWDDADYDDVIVRFTSTSSVTETHALCTLEPHWIPIWTVSAADEPLTPSPVFAPLSPQVLRASDAPAGRLPRAAANRGDSNRGNCR
jgi:hypothetical protein